MVTKKGIEIIRHMVPTQTNVVELAVMPPEPDSFEFTFPEGLTELTVVGPGDRIVRGGSVRFMIDDLFLHQQEK